MSKNHVKNSQRVSVKTSDPFIKMLSAFFILTILLFQNVLAFSGPTADRKSAIDKNDLVSANIVISQVYGGGGNAGAQYTNDFIELFNRGTTTVSVAGYSVQYASAAGGSWQATALTGSIAPGSYYLVQQAPGANSPAPLPTPNATGSIAMSGTSGKVALSSTTAALTGTCPTGGTIVDFVGYGAANCSEGSPTAGLTNTTAAIRVGGGCTETDSNSTDFAVAAPTPRNSSTTANPCSTGGTTNPSGTGAANPNTAAPGEPSLLTVAVTPGTNPTSTGITVTGNLSAIGESAAQAFLDDGMNGDVTAGDNIFSYLATIASGTSGGAKSLPVTITDSISRTGNTTISLTVTSTANAQEHLTMGNPSNATQDVNNPFNYLLPKTQYAMSYHRDRAIPNWVSWHLDSTWIGSAPRQSDFRPDPSLPAGWYQVQANSYSGSGFDRGHHTPSADRTRTVADNSATFFMTNMMPQAPDNNQGPWEELEAYCRTLVAGGNELYIIAGGVGQGGTGSNGGTTNTIDGGRITVPAQTWKVILVLPNGDDDVNRVNYYTRAIAVVMPNTQGIRANSWQSYQTTVDQVEALTGYDFFSNVNPAIQAVIEGGGAAPPTASNATVSGKVLRSDGRVIANATISYNDAQGNVKTAVTNQFGYFEFGEVEAGQTYVFRTTAKGYSFAPQVISVNDDLTNLTFVPIE